MAEPEQCPKCGCKLPKQSTTRMDDGSLIYCGDHTRADCLSNQLSTLTTRLAEVEAERDKLQDRIALQMRTIDGLDNELRAEIAWNSTRIVWLK